MRKRPTDDCRLCGDTRPLCDGHLIPAGVLRLIRAPELANPEPLHLRDDQHYTTSRPQKDYLLCERCETRFKDRGEDWVIDRCARSASEFKIRDALLRTKPVFKDANDLSIYEGAAIPGLDVKQLVYFAASIFWRAAAHKWRRSSGIVHIELGPYMEHFRLFLLDEDPFPAGISLILRVWTRDWMPRVGNPETMSTDVNAKVHAFSIPGLNFILIAGKHLDHSRQYSLAPSPQGFIGMSPRQDMEEIRGMNKRYWQAVYRGFKVPDRK